MPLQKSVFLLHCSAADLAAILQGVRQRAHLREDDIRLYPLNSPHSLWAAGQQSNAVQGLYAGKPAAESSNNWLQQVANALFG